MNIFTFNNRTYPIEQVLQIMQEYIYVHKGIHAQLKLDLNDPKEVEFFEKAANIALNWFENGMQNNT